MNAKRVFTEEDDLGPLSPTQQKLHLVRKPRLPSPPEHWVKACKGRSIATEGVYRRIWREMDGTLASACDHPNVYLNPFGFLTNDEGGLVRFAEQEAREIAIAIGNVLRDRLMLVDVHVSLVKPLIGGGLAIYLEWKFLEEDA